MNIINYKETVSLHQCTCFAGVKVIECEQCDNYDYPMDLFDKLHNYTRINLNHHIMDRNEKYRFYQICIECGYRRPIDFDRWLCYCHTFGKEYYEYLDRYEDRSFKHIKTTVPYNDPGQIFAYIPNMPRPPSTLVHLSDNPIWNKRGQNLREEQPVLILPDPSEGRRVLVLPDPREGMHPDPN